MESRLTSGGMRFQADNFMKTAIDTHAHRNGEGRISFFFHDSHSMTKKARTPKSYISFRVETTPRFPFVLHHLS